MSGAGSDVLGHVPQQLTPCGHVLQATPCKPCRVQFNDASARTCTAAAITSCSNGKLASGDGKSCVTTCRGAYYPGQFACLPIPTCTSSQYLSAKKDSCVTCPRLDRRQTGCNAAGITTCSTGFVPSADKKSCVCPSGAYQSGLNGQ